MVQLQIKIDVINKKHVYTIDVLHNTDGYTEEESKISIGLKKIITDYLMAENNKLKVVNA
jgi:hypothetical protein